MIPGMGASWVKGFVEEANCGTENQGSVIKK
jgi:hypothetical protein